MLNFLKLIRYQNLIMIALMQLLFRYGFLKQQSGIALALSDFQYLLLVLATVCIAAGGFVINNIMDQETDSISKPDAVVVGRSISETMAYNIYIAVTVLGVGIGFYLSNVIGKASFSTLFIVIAATLYLYATSLKQSLLIGNIIVALLLSVSVIIIGVFDLYPAINDGNQAQMSVLFQILLDYALFAFIFNFIREIVKDLEDMDGDYNAGMSTLPIVLGKARATKVVFALAFIPVLALIYYINKNLLGLQFVLYYALLCILGPLLYFIIKIWSAKTKTEFRFLSSLLKIILLFGILSIVVITLNMKYNA
ncbi:MULTISPECIES: geranylgeranylglycerol-phosphate geranylgeranyltransferase [unclassified Flavobacterium]|uniref:geranylgeranylglycerol-phosphate geranylgeranyltransferase n=1 Tax=unclassified Flavobacterium TaxID=196869 RepID=UPI000A929473|nr:MULTISPECIES: geranylgeranylglycerol-phosphate geranylgeranyltransferase [unclassified Flavobacterium]MBN9285915.1 geranylgeranylglycerol-phosphate geranylgeranyltransferase [Flavobacterium sp.]